MISSKSILIDKKKGINDFIESGLPKPTFQNQSSGFLVTVYGKKVKNVVEKTKKIIAI
jgi:hypothetical protein